MEDMTLITIALTATLATVFTYLVLRKIIYKNITTKLKVSKFQKELDAYTNELITSDELKHHYYAMFERSPFGIEKTKGLILQNFIIKDNKGLPEFIKSEISKFSVNMEISRATNLEVPKI